MVLLLGRRQVRKTALTLEVWNTHPSLYSDLESTSDRAKLVDPERCFALPKQPPPT